MRTDEQGLELHPAAVVFRDAIAGEIGEENQRLREETARLEPILDYIQKVEIVGTDYFPVSRGSARYESIAMVRLSEGIIVNDGNSGSMRIPILSSRGVRLNKFCPFGGMEVFMAGECLGSVMCRANNFTDCARVCARGEDDTVHLAISFSSHVYITGELSGLSHNDVAELKKEHGEHHIKLLFERHFGNFGNQSSPTFTPCEIVLVLTDTALRNKVKMIGDMTSLSENGSELEEKTHSEELWHLVVASLGDDDHTQLLEENNRLKRKREVRRKVTRVVLSHSDSMMTLSLGEGELGSDEEDNPCWIIKVEGRENASMTLRCFDNSALSIRNQVAGFYPA